MAEELIFTDNFIQLFQITIIYVLIATILKSNYLLNSMFIGLGILFILNMIRELSTNGFNIDIVLFAVFNMMVIMYIAVKTMMGSQNDEDTD